MYTVQPLGYNNYNYYYRRLEIRSVERSVCPIAAQTLELSPLFFFEATFGQLG